jgi:hypothetical protein
MKDKLAKVVSAAITVVVLGFFVFLGIKSLFVTIWLSPDQVEAYGIDGEDYRSLDIVFLDSKNEVLMLYSDYANDERESVLVKIRGEYGTHYLGPVWMLPGESWLNLRWYSEGKPARLAIEVLNKIKEGEGDESFPPIGDTSDSVILFAEDRIKFSSMWLHRKPIDEAFEYYIGNMYAALTEEDAP